MARKQWIKGKKKRRKKSRRVLIDMAITTNSDVNQLAEAYGFSIYWSNEDDTFITELDDFGLKFHSATLATGVNLAIETNKMLISEYRNRGIALPVVS